MWSAERVALLKERYPNCADLGVLLVAINALPGPGPVPHTKSIQSKASALSVKRTPSALKEAMRRGGLKSHGLVFVDRAEPIERAEPPACPIEQAEQCDAVMAKRHEVARALLRKKVTESLVAMNARLPLREVFRLKGEMRGARK
jgi:hypothetical protein